MNKNEKIPLYGPEDDEFLGYIVGEDNNWQSQTIFGHPIAFSSSRRDAEKILEKQGLTYLRGVWQYYDKDESDWFPCVIKEAYPNKVIVNRTNELGYQDPETYKQVLIEKPDENSLIKST